MMSRLSKIFVLFSVKARRALFAKDASKMWLNTGNQHGVKFVNFPPLSWVEDVNVVLHITKDMDLQKPVISVNKSVLLIEE